MVNYFFTKNIRYVDWLEYNFNFLNKTIKIEQGAAFTETKRGL